MMTDTTAMQIDGKLTKWNTDRGVGFITPNLGGQEIFVHVSAFPRDGERPRLGEPLSFERRQRVQARPPHKMPLPLFSATVEPIARK